MSWHALWHRGAALPVGMPGGEDGAPGIATLRLEWEAPRRWRKPLRLWRGRGDAAVALALHQLPTGGLRLWQGAVDVTTPAGFAQPGDRMRLTYAVAGASGRAAWTMANRDSGQNVSGAAAVSEPVGADALMPQSPEFCRVMTLAGVANHLPGGTAGGGLAAGTRLRADRGYLPVEALRPGDRIALCDGDRAVLREIVAEPVPCWGAEAPVALGLHGASPIVTPGTRILQCGPEIQYLFGTDAALVRAGDLLPPPRAEIDRARPLRLMVALDLDRAGCVQLEGCAVAMGPLDEGCDEGLPLLDRGAARELRSSIARRQRRAI